MLTTLNLCAWSASFTTKAFFGGISKYVQTPPARVIDAHIDWHEPRQSKENDYELDGRGLFPFIRSDQNVLVHGLFSLSGETSLVMKGRKVMCKAHTTWPNLSLRYYNSGVEFHLHQQIGMIFHFKIETPMQGREIATIPYMQNIVPLQSQLLMRTRF